jgi:hypothetical protein
MEISCLLAPTPLKLIVLAMGPIAVFLLVLLTKPFLAVYELELMTKV